jgi:hypothetical protein
MQKYHYKILLFTLILLVVNALFDQFYKRVIMHNSLLNRSERAFRQYDGDLHFLLMGDSHMFRGVKPEIIGKGYNYSTQGESYIQNFYKLKQLLEKEKRSIRYLVLPLDPHSFSSFRDTKIKDDAFWVKYINYFELAKEVKQRDIIFKYFYGRYFSYAGNFENIYLWNRLKRSPLREFQRGYLPGFQSFAREKEKVKKAKERAAHHFASYEVLSPFLIRYLQKIIDLCSAHHIKLLFIQFPLSREYDEALTQYMDTDSFYRTIDSLFLDHESVSGILDFHDLYFERPDFFINADHMNDAGATNFSLLLKRIVEDKKVRDYFIRK